MRIDVKNLSKEFNGIKVLDNVNLQFEEGKIYGLIGRNGSGKSVFLKILCNFYAPTSGEVLFDNINIYKEHNNILKAVDGGITLERAQECKNCGVNIYIGGTSSLYKKNTNKLSNKELEQNIVKINFIINNIVKTNE